jgi:hypothetical protein
MIAKATWFNRRKYSGWGLTPKNWQGVVYIMGIAAIVAIIQNLGFNETYKLIISIVLIIFILVDLLQAMAAIKLDEREQKIEAIAERNASWTMVAASALSIIYVSTIGKDLNGTELIPVLILPILVGTVAKGVSNYILDRKGV